MYIRPKTKRRLVILGGTVAVIAVLIAGGYLIHARRARAELAKARSAAMTAYAAGDYAGALPGFSVYLANSKTIERGPGEVDTEALLAYAKSRAAVELPKGKHLFEAVNVLERYLRLKPDDAEARRTLLELYPRIAFFQEAIELADSILATEPLNADALRTKCDSIISKARQDRKLYADALQVSLKLNEAAPLDVRGQLQTLMLMSQTRVDDSKIVGRAEDLRAKRPEDPRFELVLASAYALTHQAEAARSALKRAADATPPDPQYVIQLVKQLDGSQMYDRSEQALEHAEGLLHDPELARLLARRMWQQGEYAAVAKRLESIDPKSRTSDTDLLAIRAMALETLDRNAEANVLVDALSDRANDSAARAWAIALKTWFARPAPDPKSATTQYSAALDKDGDNAVIHFMLADAYSRMGEKDLAIESWKRALMYAPTWTAPFSMIARTMIDTGDFEGARQVAYEAHRRSPSDGNLAADYVIATYGALGEKATPEELNDLLRVVADIQSQAPGEPRTLPIYVDLLARTGDRPAAISVVEAALKSDKAPTALTIDRLQVIGKQRKLAIDDAMRSFLAASPAKVTPASAQRSALVTANTRSPADGLREIQAARQQAISAGADATANLDWSLAVLQFRDAIGDDADVADWITVADSNPKDLRVQIPVLHSRAKALDHALWQRTIDRVRELTSDTGQLWQLERARLVLSGKPSEKELNETLSRLSDLARATPDSPEPYRLLAKAYERSGEGAEPDARRAAQNRAIDEMTKAADLRPNDMEVQSEFVRMLRAAGRADKASERLDRLAMHESLDPTAQRWIAAVYGDLGQTDKALDLLSNATGPAADDPALIAQRGLLYARSGKFDEAAKQYRRMLTLPKPDAGSLIEAAQFFAARSQRDEAEKFLERASAIAPAAAVAGMRARFLERFGSAVEALAQYQAAVDSAGGESATPFRELAGYQMRQRRFDDAIVAATSGLKRYPKDGVLAALRDRADSLKPLGNDPSLDTLVGALSLTPDNAAAIEMLKILVKARSAKASTEQLVTDLRRAADAYPDFLPLQFSAARGHLALDQPDRAEQIAGRTAGLFPNDPDAMGLLCRVYAAREDWIRLKDAAMTLRRLSPDNPMPADATLAQALLETGDPTGAIQRLEPYVPPMTKAAETVSGGQAAAILSLYAQALIAAGRTADAEVLLEPLARESTVWREIWMKLATAKHGSAGGAEEWLERIAPLIPPAAWNERSSLGLAWLGVGERFNDRAAYENARQIGLKLVGAPASRDAVDSWLVLGTASQALGDLENAENGYRKVLELRPDIAEGKNNLAFVLLLRGGNDRLVEASKLANAAVAATANQASFRDTLARIQAKSGQTDAAALNFRRAIELDAKSTEARLGLASLLASTGKRSDARALLEQVERALKLGAPLTPASEKELKDTWLAVRGQSSQTMAE